MSNWKDGPVTKMEKTVEEQVGEGRSKVLLNLIALLVIQVKMRDWQLVPRMDLVFSGDS